VSGRPARLQVVAVGRLRPPLREAGLEYEARVAARIPLRVDEVAGEPLQHGEDQVMRREGERLRGRTLPGAWRVGLSSAGPAPTSSEAFARWLERRLEDPRPTSFLVGGALGLPPDIEATAEERLSLGPLTMPHQLARVVLAEQLYRALCLLAGHPYPH
jgi:23S rRNA (pseudouridine1915-N3)-methyltransferase